MTTTGPPTYTGAPSTSSAVSITPPSIDPALALLLVGTVGAALLVPIAVAFCYVCSRMQPRSFFLGCLSVVALGLAQGAINVFVQVRSFLALAECRPLLNRRFFGTDAIASGRILPVNEQLTCVSRPRYSYRRPDRPPDQYQLDLHVACAVLGAPHGGAPSAFPAEARTLRFARFMHKRCAPKKPGFAP